MSADTGLARQRTTLAWTRTALALGGNGLLVLLRHPRDFPLGASFALAGGAVAVAVVCLVAGRTRAVVMVADAPPGPDARLLAVLAVAITLLCLGTIAVIVLDA